MITKQCISTTPADVAPVGGLSYALITSHVKTANPDPEPASQGYLAAAISADELSLDPAGIQ